jgi:DNA-binding LytR/AlgR family response regulator
VADTVLARHRSSRCTPRGTTPLRQQETCSHLLREPISILEKKLRDYGFIRIHRSILINSSFVEGVEVRLSGGYGLRMRTGREYTVTRTYKKNLKDLAQPWIRTDGLPGD